jgi:hypothetical protein
MTSDSTGEAEKRREEKRETVLYYNIIISYSHQIINTFSGGPLIA